MKQMTSIVTAVSRGDQIDALDRLIKRIDGLVEMQELVVVCEGLAGEDALKLTQMVEATADATLHFLPEPVSEVYSLLIGLDNAIGSVCLLVSLDEKFEGYWSEAFKKVEAGYDVALMREPASTRTRSLYRAARSSFLALYSILTGVKVSSDICKTRVISRSALQYLMSRRDAEMLFNAESLGSGFSCAILDVQSSSNGAPPKRSIGSGLSKAYRSLSRSAALPVRGIVWLSLWAAVFNACYSIYVAVSFVLSDDIAPGWTTLSLQISVGFFLLALALAILGELVISIDRGTNYRMRYFVQREVRSPKSKLSSLRNLDFGEEQSKASEAERDGR